MVTQKLYHTGGQQCSVAAYELLISKRPTELKDHGPLYLSPFEKRDNSQDLQKVLKSPTRSTFH